MHTHLSRALLLFVLLSLALPAMGQTLSEDKTTGGIDAHSTLILHYHRPQGDYDTWNLWVWPDQADGKAYAFTGFDDFGAYAIIPFNTDHARFGFIVRKGEWEEKDIADDRFIETNAQSLTEVWIEQGNKRLLDEPLPSNDEPAEPGFEDDPPMLDLSKVQRIAPDSTPGSLLVLHYRNTTEPDAEAWDVWAWTDNQEGKAVAFTQTTNFGQTAFITYDARESKIHFIVRKPDWSRKDVDMDRSAVLNAQGVGEIWLVAQDSRVYTDPSQIDLSIQATSAFLDGPDQIRVGLSQAVSPHTLAQTPIHVWIDDQPATIRSIVPHGLSIAGARDYTLTLAAPIAPDDIAKPITLEWTGLKPIPVAPRNVLEDAAYTAWDTPLGYDYASDATVFRLWSPVASQVDLLLFDDAKTDTPNQIIPMDRHDQGVWSTRVEEDLNQTYYLYRLTINGQQRTVPDVNGYAATADSARSLVLDLRKTDPAGFREHQPPVLAQPTDEVIYEVHVRDFSIADPTTPLSQRGKYLGLTHLNPSHQQQVSTGLSHLKDLGVTAIHLLPIQDYTASMEEYNWGYWTALFNVPEAQYATDPSDPAQTIRELKQAIQILHENGIRVILDVVYNHTSTSFAASPFDQTVPWYYFRTTPDGKLRNESGTGNAFADERPMARKYIVDSLRYWLTEYKVDGFRFDLIGMNHPETVKMIARELRAIRPDITLYGEPWTGGGPIHFGKGAQRGTTVALFNDHFRHAIRGDLDGNETGFATGPGGDRDAVQRGVAGAIDDFADAPTESVVYVSAHDNRTFWDKLQYTYPNLDDATKQAMVKLAHGIILTSQGIPFLHGGADWARTKGGHHNSYNAGDAVNAFDWTRKARYRNLNHYFSGLIKLRKEHPAFRMTSAHDVRANLKFLPDEPVLAFVLNGHSSGDSWKHMLVAYNGEPKAQRVALPQGSWQLVVNDQHAGTDPIQTLNKTYTLPPYSMIVAYQD